MINEYIKNNLGKTLRECHEDKHPFFALPRPYNVPCATGMFQEMYYWDSYFANAGLLIIGDVVQAKNNVDNLRHANQQLHMNVANIFYNIGQMLEVTGTLIDTSDK